MTSLNVNKPNDPVFDLPRLTWETLEVVRAQHQPIRVSDLNLFVGQRLSLDYSMVTRPESGETDFLYNMRYARMILVYQASAIERIPNVQGWEQEWHAYRATQSASEVKQENISHLVTEFLGNHKQGQGYRNRRQGSQTTRRPPSKQSPPWDYDYVKWAFQNLRAVQRICSTARSGLDLAANAQINEEVASEMQLTVEQRKVASLRNPTELEYKARGGTMRRLLELLRLIERNPDDKKYWMPAEHSDGMTEVRLKERIESYFKEATVELSSLGGPTWGYRGNRALEDLAAREGEGHDDSEGSTSTAGIQIDTESRPLVLTGSRQAGGAELVLADIDLCVSAMEALQEVSISGRGIKQDDLVENVGKRINAPQEYLELDGPPWGRRGRGIDTLFAYRMEHVLRSLSVDPANLIQVRGGEDGNEIGGEWSLSGKGQRFSNVYRDQARFTAEVQKLVSDYFEIHSYENWRYEPWMQEYYEYLTKNAGRDGTPFEYLCAEIMRRIGGFAVVQVQGKGSALDHEGVDIVAKTQVRDTTVDLATFGNVPVYGIQEVVWFVQCKMWLREDARSDAVSKIHGYWLAQNSVADTNGGYSVGGARLIVAGDLGRGASRQYWIHRQNSHRGDASEAQEAESSAWDLWDGGKVLQLMEEHGVGLQRSVTGVVQGIDRGWFDRLPRAEK